MGELGKNKIKEFILAYSYQRQSIMVENGQEQREILFLIAFLLWQAE